MGNPQHTLRIGHLSRALHNWRIQPHRHESSLSYQCSLLIHYKMTKFDNLKIKFNIPCTISEAKGLTFNMPCTTVVHTHSHFYSHTNISIIMVYDSYELSLQICLSFFLLYRWRPTVLNICYFVLSIFLLHITCTMLMSQKVKDYILKKIVFSEFQTLL